MVSGPRFLSAVFILLCTLMVLAGCIAVAIGETSYADGNIRIHISNTGAPAETYIQVTVYEIKDFRQQEFTVLNTTTLLEPGENVVSVPGNLHPGSYKLIIYLIRDNDRKSAGIRDILVT